MPSVNIKRKHSEATLAHVREQIEKFYLIENMSHQQTGPRQDVVQHLVERQQKVHLGHVLEKLHFADVAWVIENLSARDRLLVWQLQAAERGGRILLELSDSVAEQIIENSPVDLLKAALAQLGTEELGYISNALPRELLQETLSALSNDDKSWLESARQYPPNTVGSMMGRDMVIVRESDSLKQVLKDLRRRGELPQQNDKLFVVDLRGHLVGVLPVEAVVLNPSKTPISEVMSSEVVTFQADESATHAARAFERYNLVSAPVLNQGGRPVGRLTVDEVMDFVRDDISEDALNSVGIEHEEDLFAPVLNSARNRWVWLSLSLLTAFVASRVIGLFEETITQFVALAALMPIVAAIGGNTGNQTTTLVVRGLALAQINEGNRFYLIKKEMTLSLLNGVVWGGLVGIFTFVFYSNLLLSLIIMLAMMITLLLAAILGLGIPLLLQAMHRDPALGSSVLVTALTDSMGFFIFLGLAALLL